MLDRIKLEVSQCSMVDLDSRAVSRLNSVMVTHQATAHVEQREILAGLVKASLWDLSPEYIILKILVQIQVQTDIFWCFLVMVKWLVPHLAQGPTLISC